MTGIRVTLYFTSEDYAKIEDYAKKTSEISGVEIAPNQIVKSWIIKAINSLDNTLS